MGPFSRRRQAWGSREEKVWEQSPARWRRATWAAPGPGQEKVHSLLPLLPRLQPKPQAGPPAPANRRHSFLSRGTGDPAAPRPAGKENLPPLLLRPPEQERKTGAPCNLRRNSQSQERAAALRAKAPAKAPHPGRDRLLVAGRKVRPETVESESTCEDSETEISSDEEENTNERIIEWLIGVNECLYREPRLGHWTSLSHLEEDTSIKIVHEGD